jgi:small subunit ribosomal protein S16
MAVKIRLARRGAKHRPYYKVVIADARAPRDGSFLEIIGTYDPFLEKDKMQVDAERASHWLKQGAQPTERLAKFFKLQNIKAA